MLLARTTDWSRDAILDWLVEQAEADSDLIVGLDLSPALPFAEMGGYFPGALEQPQSARDQIGRASCRERVCLAV